MSEETQGTEVATAEETPLPANGTAPLAINETALRSLAAEKVTDTLPPAAYERLSESVPLTEAQEALLAEPLAAEDVEIKPDDGSVYASHEFYRRKLNAVFGRMGWALLPGSPLTQRPQTNEWYQRWTLFIGGIYRAEAFESYDYQPNNARMDLSDVAEAIKSGALKRCCKDLSIAHECWDKRWTERWRRENAIQVMVQTSRGNVKQWRRKDQEPLRGEMKQNVAPPPTTARQPEASAASPASPPAGTQAPPKAAAPSKPSVQPKASGAAPASERSGGSPPAAAPKPAAKPVTMVPDPKSASTPRLLDSQIRLLFARGRNAGLIVGEDASPMIEWLGEFGISVVTSDGKTSSENCHSTMRNIPPNQMNPIVKKLDELAKAAKPESTGDAEKI